MPGDELTLDKDTFSKDEVAQLIAERNRGLEANRNEALNEAKKLKQRLAALDGIDPEEFKTLKAEREAAQAQKEEAERKQAEAAGNWKSVQEQIEKKHAAEVQRIAAEKDSVLSHLHRTLIDNAAILELAKHSDSPKLLLPHVKSMMKVVNEDGEYAARIVDEKGNVRIGKGQGNAPMTLAELMDEMKQDKEFASAFRGSGSSGGGASRSHASGGGQSTITTDDGQNFLKNLKGISDGSVTVKTNAA